MERRIPLVDKPSTPSSSPTHATRYRPLPADTALPIVDVVVVSGVDGSSPSVIHVRDSSDEGRLRETSGPVVAGENPFLVDGFGSDLEVGESSGAFLHGEDVGTRAVVAWFGDGRGVGVDEVDLMVGLGVGLEG